MKINSHLNSTVIPRKGLVKGIDTMRFFSAIWVVLYHGGRFPIGQLVHGARAATAENLNKLPFSGVGAVVLFFVISGFCIHFPNVHVAKLNWIAFWCKRMIRILIPFFAIQIIASLIGTGYLHSVELVFWTIYCEVFYYLCYPVLFYLTRRFGMSRCILGSSLISLVIAIMHFRMTFIPDLGIWEASIFCLPMWLLGCQMAEHFKNGKNPASKGSLWTWRLAGITIASTGMVLAHTHPAIGYLWTMPIFSIYAVLWLRHEFIAATEFGTIAWLERLGMAGYSIYLTHKISINWADQQYAAHHVWYIVWPTEWVGIAMISAAFFWLIEYPSHRLAKFVGSKLSSSSKAAEPKITLKTAEPAI